MKVEETSLFWRFITFHFEKLNEAQTVRKVQTSFFAFSESFHQSNSYYELSGALASDRKHHFSLFIAALEKFEAQTVTKGQTNTLSSNNLIWSFEHQRNLRGGFYMNHKHALFSSTSQENVTPLQMVGKLIVYEL